MRNNLLFFYFCSLLPHDPVFQACMPSNTLTDEELVHLYVRTQLNQYFELLYQRYSEKVFKKCYSFVRNSQQAEDLTHDIFLKLIVKIGTFKESARFSTWLYSITYNYCMDQLRSGKRSREIPLDAEVAWEDDTHDDLAELQASGLKHSLEKLDPKDRALLLMKYQDDFSIKEIAEALQTTESAVKMRLMRSKERLRKIYLENIVFYLAIILKLLYFWKR